MYARPQTRPKPRKAQSYKWAAPVAGWVSNRALADPATNDLGPGAVVLDNFFPRATGVSLRRGKQLYATLMEDNQNVGALFSYKNGANEKLFAASDTTIYDVSNVVSPTSYAIGTDDGDLISDGTDGFGETSTGDFIAETGYTSGDWSVIQFATTGGVFLLGVNGSDEGFLYDGTSFAPLAITFPNSLTTADMSFIWAYRNRIWMIENDSLNAWYLDVDSIAGAATMFPLGGLFGNGGSLIFGARWSLESGDSGGLSEQQTFVTTSGEVAIYQGGDPSNASDWRLTGIYRIGNPLGKRAFIRGGGDLAIATTAGLVPLSKAIELEVTALSVATISYKIADSWNDAIRQRGALNWQAYLWPEEKMAIVAPPNVAGANEPVMFVSNTETGAWARYTNWQAFSMEVFKGQLYFGSDNGQIFKANMTGLDEGLPYTGVCIPLYTDAGDLSSSKIGKMARAITRSNTQVQSRLDLLNDYTELPPPPPDATMIGTPNIWGGGIWGTSIWASTSSTVMTAEWVSVGGYGYVMAPCYQITSGSTVPLDVELISIEALFTATEYVG